MDVIEHCLNHISVVMYTLTK